jgi:outer membrane lipoprotein-sorting protein
MMKKTVSLIVGGVFLLAVLSTPAASQTAKDILAKMIEAQGGAKALAAIKDTTITGTIQMVSMGMNGTITMYQKEPNMMRMDIEIMGMVITQAYDGNIAWMVNPQTGATEQMPEAMTQSLKRQAMGNDALLNPEKYGIKYEFKGKEKIADKDYLMLEQTTADGHKTTMYLDPATYLPYKAKGMELNSQTGTEVMTESVFGDYRKEGDTIVAHSLTTYQDGQEFMKMAITKVGFNANLEDSFFKMSK